MHYRWLYSLEWSLTPVFYFIFFSVFTKLSGHCLELNRKWSIQFERICSRVYKMLENVCKFLLNVLGFAWYLLKLCVLICLCAFCMLKMHDDNSIESHDQINWNLNLIPFTYCVSETQCIFSCEFLFVRNFFHKMPSLICVHKLSLLHHFWIVCITKS